MTRQQALEVGRKLAAEIGLANVSRSNLCEAMGIPNGSLKNVVGCQFTEFFEELKTVVGDSPGNFSVTKTRADPELRKDSILNSAMTLAAEIGYNRLTRAKVAEAAGVSESLVSKNFGTMEQLKNDIVRRAIKTENLKIIAQGLVTNNRHIKKVSSDLKHRALKCLI